MPSSVKNLQQHMHAHVSWGTLQMFLVTDMPQHAKYEEDGQGNVAYRQVGMEMAGKGSDIQISSRVRVRGRRPRLDMCHHSQCNAIHFASQCNGMQYKGLAQISTAFPENWVARAGEPHMDNVVTAIIRMFIIGASKSIVMAQISNAVPED